MKITKLKKGYRINLTDTEMSLLLYIHAEGIEGVYEQHAENMSGLETAEKRILTEVINGTRPWLFS
jgi:hypothetical protein